MLTIRVYETIEQDVPTAELQADYVDVGYLRKGRDQGGAQLRATIDVTQRSTSSLTIDPNMAVLLKNPMSKIEVVNGENVIEIAQGVSYVCTNINTKYSSSVGETAPEYLNTIYTFREHVV